MKVLPLCIVALASISGVDAFQPLGKTTSGSISTNIASSSKGRLVSATSNEMKFDTSLGIFGKLNKSSQAQVEKVVEEVDDDVPSFALNPPFALAWIALVIYAFGFAPGELGGANDAAMLDQIIANPMAPGINELFYTIFNFFVVMPVILASIVLPQGQKKGLPAGPFLFGTAFLGYFVMGPYLSLRAPPLDKVDPSNVSWFTSKVLENKIFQAGLLAFTFYLPFGSGLVPALEDPAALWQGFVNLITSSRFASVSIVDLAILYASIVALTPRDYLLRNPTSDQATANKIAALTALLPYLGTAAYCLWRPSLPQEE